MLIGTSTTVAVSNASPNVNTPVSFTVTVSSQTGTTVPTGNVIVSVDGAGTPYGTGTPTTLPLQSNGTATLSNISFTTGGNHQVVAQYQGDSTHAASTGVISITVQGGSTGTGTFTMSATNVTISQGAQGTSTITVTPAGGYKGTINILPSASNASFCYSATQAVVSGTIAVTSTLTIDTNLLDCQGASIKSHGMHLFSAGGRKAQTIPRTGPSIMRSAIGIAGIFFAGLIGWRFRRSRLVASVIVLGMLGFVLSGCGGGGSNNTNDTPKGTYTVTLTGQDSTTSTITANTNMTLVVN